MVDAFAHFHPLAVGRATCWNQVSEAFKGMPCYSLASFSIALFAVLKPQSRVQVALL
jgi:hypothetical protein